MTHPNVCRIFDVFHHQSGTTEVTFLTMELLQGETLTERLRKGRMSPAEAMPIVRQMADALTAAHNAGIIHRDFKSANVMLVAHTGARASVAAAAVRVVVTDFGLARSSGDAMASISGTGDIVGTPAYMAPEQVLGEEITAATDIYALGVVMYEMITGTLPFVGDTPLSVATKRLKEVPLSPRTYVPDLDEKWESAILRSLEREWKKRFGQCC